MPDSEKPFYDMGINNYEGNISPYWAERAKHLGVSIADFRAVISAAMADAHGYIFNQDDQVLYPNLAKIWKFQKLSDDGLFATIVRGSETHEVPRPELCDASFVDQKLRFLTMKKNTEGESKK